MRPFDLLALNVFKEAWLEPDDGKAAIARVVKNRMKLQYFSDGTISDTILRRNQFSWVWFDFVNGKYTQICFSPTEAQIRVEHLLTETSLTSLTHCREISQQVFNETYHGKLYDSLTDDVVLYLNPKISTRDWASPDKLVSIIGHHNFYRR